MSVVIVDRPKSNSPRRPSCRGWSTDRPKLSIQKLSIQKLSIPKNFLSKNFLSPKTFYPKSFNPAKTFYPSTRRAYASSTERTTNGSVPRQARQPRDAAVQQQCEAKKCAVKTPRTAVSKPWLTPIIERRKKEELVQPDHHHHTHRRIDSSFNPSVNPSKPFEGS